MMSHRRKKPWPDAVRYTAQGLVWAVVTGAVLLSVTGCESGQDDTGPRQGTFMGWMAQHPELGHGR